MHLGESPDQNKGQSGIVRAALLGLCPRCASKTLFEAPGRIAAQCSQCDLKLSDFERGGRLAGLITMVFAVALIGLTLWIDSQFRPPIWLMFALLAPLTVGGTLFVLRFYKTTLLYAAYDNREGTAE